MYDRQDESKSKSDEKKINSKAEIQRENKNPEFQKELQLKATIQRKNNTGIPDNLKSGIENLSGHSLDDVEVHYNSNKPAQLNAHAYAQGNQIHLGSGQEKHLAHEAWHVVQQKQGRVKPTINVNGAKVNDDLGLEKEADVMGGRALQMKSTKCNGEGCGCAACSGKVNKAETYQLKLHSLGNVNYALIQMKCSTCGAKSHKTNKCPKTTSDKTGKSSDMPVRIVSRDGCYDDDKCSNRLSGADFCHNCNGTHVKWTYDIGSDIKSKSFCFPCSYLGKDEKRAKIKMQTGAEEYGKSQVKT